MSETTLEKRVKDLESMLGDQQRLKGLMRKRNINSIDELMEKLDEAHDSEDDHDDEEENEEPKKKRRIKARRDEKSGDDEEVIEAENAKLVEDALAEFLTEGAVRDDTIKALSSALVSTGVDPKIATEVIRNTISQQIAEYREQESRLRKELGDDFNLAQHVIWANENYDKKTIDFLSPRLEAGDVDSYRIIKSDFKKWSNEHPKDSERFRNRFADVEALQSKGKTDESVESSNNQQVSAGIKVEEGAPVIDGPPEFKRGRVMPEESKTEEIAGPKPYESVDDYDRDLIAPDADSPESIRRRQQRLDASPQSVKDALEYTSNAPLQRENANTTGVSDQS